MKENINTYYKAYTKELARTEYKCKNNIRASGKTEPNTPERLEEIKEKYKNGIPKGTVEKWIMSL